MKIQSLSANNSFCQNKIISGNIQDVLTKEPIGFASIYLKKSQDDGNTWDHPKIVRQTMGYSDHPLLISHGKQVFLSWLTRSDGYQFIKVGQSE